MVWRGDRLLGVTRDEPEHADVIEVDGVICPGFVDAHVHVESSGLRPARYAETVVREGTTAVVWDPHEVVNVSGELGLEWAVKTSEEALPFKFYIALPSCVPALGPPYETVRGEITVDVVRKFATHPMVVSVGELMDVAGVMGGEKDEFIELRDLYGLTVDGHAPGLTGLGAMRYFAAGPETDHECSTAEEFVSRRELGVWTFVRQGSSSRDMEVALETLEDLRGVCFVTDDLHVRDMDEVSLRKMVGRAIEAGFDPLEALGAVTLNPSLCYGLRSGRLAPGFHADVVVVEDLDEDMELVEVWIGGERSEHVRFRDAELELPDVELSDPREVSFQDGRYEARCIGLVRGSIRTEEIVREVTVENGVIKDDDVAFLVVADRYGQGSWSMGFVEGFEELDCALVSTVAHDSHNVVVAGRRLDDVRRALRLVSEVGGCVGAVAGERVEFVRLDVAGLMSSSSPEEVRESYEGVLELIRSNSGVDWDPFQVLSFVTLPVIPELRLTDRGLVRVEPDDVRFVDVIIDDGDPVG
ncbi:adenine deaminase C-terminal domain-containing protein [Methanopyrus sp.]